MFHVQLSKVDMTRVLLPTLAGCAHRVARTGRAAAGRANILVATAIAVLVPGVLVVAPISAQQGGRPPVTTDSATAAGTAGAARKAARDSIGRAKRDSAAQSLGAVVVRDSTPRRMGYSVMRTRSATRTDTRLIDVPQSVSVVSKSLITDQAMQSMADVVRYVPGVSMALGEGHRDATTIRGNATTADFFVDGVRDDAQYLRDLYNVERVEALKGANAMTFGRGGGGGVLNRVTKDAQWTNRRALNFEGGSFDHKRSTLDLGQAITGNLAARVSAMYEKSGGFRDASRVHREAINPTLAFMPNNSTVLRLGYEYLHDDRTVDRGVPSYFGAIAPTPVTTFFGNPEVNLSTMVVQTANATIEHAASHGIVIRNRTMLAAYNKFYQNTFPGAVTSGGTQVALSAHNHRIDRHNLFNQTDVTGTVRTGDVLHGLLIGAELGTQTTQQFRNTGYFNGTASSLLVPFVSPTVTSPVTFRQSVTDADNNAIADVGALYVQDQIAITTQWQAIVGVRAERFSLHYHNNRDNSDLSRVDRLVSPRVGVIYKPMELLSLYGGVSRSWLPSTGDQFTALTVTTQALQPERFTNQEIGMKWDVKPALSVTAAVYQLDRTNTTAPNPLDATRVVQTGGQRTVGSEAGFSGDVTSYWQIAGGVAVQRAWLVRTTTAAKAGATVPLVPHTTASLWNKLQLGRGVAAGLGLVHQTRMYAAIDNTVILPDFTRVDAALYARLPRGLRAQLNLENALDRRYVASSHGNNNIMPGATRTLRLSLSADR